MRCVIQRVKSASCSINDEVISQIDKGLLVLVGFQNSDTTKEIDKMCDKLVNLRIMSDNFGALNFSILDLKQDIMVIPNFTLYADASHGRRPSFVNVGDKVESKHKYEYMLKHLKETTPLRIGYGGYGADMSIFLINDGPVTLVIDEDAKND